MSEDRFSKNQIQRTGYLDIHRRALDNRDRSPNPLYKLRIIGPDESVLIRLPVSILDDRQLECLWSLRMKDASPIQCSLDSGRLNLFDRVGRWQRDDGGADGCRAVDHKLYILWANEGPDGIVDCDHTSLIFVQYLEPAINRILPFSASSNHSRYLFQAEFGNQAEHLSSQIGLKHQDDVIDCVA